jgi:uncharacterized repeat protein (TIGR01451 family)
LANLTPLSAQGWDFYFGGDNEDYGHAIVQTSDLGYLLVGYSESFPNGQDQDFDVYVVKTDVDGTLLWERTYDPGLVEFGRSLQETSDGGYLIAGEVTFGSASGPFEGLLLKIDPNGELIWQQTYTVDGVNSVRVNDLINTTDDGHLIIGYAEYEDQEDDILLIKVNAAGEQQWNKIIGTDLGEQANAGVSLENGFIIVGNADNPVPPPTAFGSDAVVYRLDENGDEIWSQTVSTLENETGADVILDESDHIVVVGDRANDIGLWKFDLDGNLIDEVQQDFFGLGDEANSIILSETGNYIIAGRTEVTGTNVDQLIAGFTPDLDLAWFNNNGDNINSDEALGVAPRANGGYATVGASGLFLTFVNDLVLTTTNPEGGIFTNYIRGTVFQDLDSSCDLDPGERRLEGWLVRAIGSEDTFYGTTDANGAYEILVDTGSFVVQPLPINKNWESCQPNGINITFSETYDFINLNGPMTASVPDCPSMEVDVSTPFLSPCSDITYTVRYANEGSGIAEDASVEIVLDETLEFIDASLPFTLDGEVYRFELGTVDYNTKGSFTIQTRVACDGIVEGQTALVSAQILPDSSCFSPDPGWNGASVSVNGTCDGDEAVEFQISNTGSDMPSPGNFFVVEEDLVVFMTNTFDLEENQDTTIVFGNPEGKTYRIIAEQVEGHPGSSMPTKAVEGCGQNNDGIFSTGFVTQWAENDADPAISLHVDEIFSEQPAVFLQGHPEGWRDSIITAETELTYRIFFRNTGLDSTTTIVIRDTLPEDVLDITTFEPGASSHPAQIEVFNTGVLRVTFEDITLPVGTDGSTNTDDYGFFEFRIKQQPGNPSGTVIENEALVYIENNPPLATNTERHVIEGATATDLLEIIPVDVDEPEGLPTVSVDAFPNPATDFVTLQVNGLQGSYDVAFSLMNMQGQVLRYSEVNDYQYTFQREQLPAGSYIYTVRVNGQTAAAGTLIIR